MFDHNSYPTVNMSYTTENSLNVTPSHYKNKQENQQPNPDSAPPAKTYAELNEQSTHLLINHVEVLEVFQISSRATIYKWRQKRGFPEPITLMPLRWLRSAIEEWKDYTSRFRTRF
ncbi:TPA: helix-turn-helix transcriptional regulator [Photobacterium damselae]